MEWGVMVMEEAVRGEGKGDEWWGGMMGGGVGLDTEG